MEIRETYVTYPTVANPGLYARFLCGSVNNPGIRISHEIEAERIVFTLSVYLDEPNQARVEEATQALKEAVAAMHKTDSALQRDLAKLFDLLRLMSPDAGPFTPREFSLEWFSHQAKEPRKINIPVETAMGNDGHE